MRYLKTYEAWDQINNNTHYDKIDSDLRETIIDIVKSECDLEEINYLIDFRFYSNYSGQHYPAMFVYFRDRRNGFFRIRDFKDTLLRIKDVCDMFGYSVDAEIPSEDETQMTFDEFLSFFEHDELFRLRLSIYKNEINESMVESEELRTIPKDIQQDIIDLSWELKDEGFKIGYQWWKPISAHDSFRLDSYPYISVAKFGYIVKYKEISDFCERISNYLKSRGYKTNIQCMVSDRRNLTHFVNLESDDTDVESEYYKIQIIEDSINESVSTGAESYKHRIRYTYIANILQNVKDIFLELSDDGYLIDSQAISRNMSADSIQVHINYMKISKDALEYIHRLSEYMGSKRVFKEPEIFVSYRDNKNYIIKVKPLINIDDLIRLFDEDVNINTIKITFTILKPNEL